MRDPMKSEYEAVLRAAGQAMLLLQDVIDEDGSDEESVEVEIHDVDILTIRFNDYESAASVTVNLADTREAGLSVDDEVKRACWAARAGAGHAHLRKPDCPRGWPGVDLDDGLGNTRDTFATTGAPMADIHPLNPRRLHPECRDLARETGQPHAVIDGVYCRDVDYVAVSHCAFCGVLRDDDSHPLLCREHAIEASTRREGAGRE